MFSDGFLPNTGWRWWLFYALLLVPSVAGWAESGHWPSQGREWTSDAILTVLVGVLMWNIIRWTRRVEYYSRTDILTGLFNRLVFQENLNNEIIRAQRFGTELVLAYLDIDRFKSINDRFGHKIGDVVLQKIGSILQTGVRGGVDSSYRIGGDEFVLLFPTPDAGGVEGIRKRLDELKDRVDRILQPYQARSSIGCTRRNQKDTAETFLERADMAMYQEKKNQPQRKMSLAVNPMGRT